VLIEIVGDGLMLLRRSARKAIVQFRFTRVTSAVDGAKLVPFAALHKARYKFSQDCWVYGMQNSECTASKGKRGMLAVHRFVA
jgi:hypothetical protein